MTAPALVGPAVGEAPSGRALRRVLAQTANRRGGARPGEVLGDLYYAVIMAAIGAGVALGIADTLRDVLAPPDRPGVPEGPGVASAVPWLLVAAAAVLVGVAGRLGPVGVGGAEATWLLGTPVERRGLLRPAARRFPLLAAFVGAGVVALLDAGFVAADGAHVARAAGVGALAAALVVVLAGLAQTLQATRRAVAGVGDAALALVPVAALGVALAGGRLSVPSAVPPAVLGALAVALVVAWVVLDLRLGALRDRSLRESGSVAAQAAGALVSLDSRELGRALTDATAPARRRRSRRARWVRGARAAVVRADAAVLLRSFRHLAQVAVAAAVPVAVARTPDLAGPGTFVVALLVAGGVAAGASAEAARRAEMAPAVDRLLPLDARDVHRLHLVVPVAAMLAWSLVAYAAIGWWWGTGLGPWLALAVCAAPVWAAAAVRSAYRPAPDWGGALVATPMGALPAGVAGVVARGPDVALLGHVPVVVAVLLGTVPPALLAVQVAVSAVCLAVGSSTETRSLTERALGTGGTA